MHSVNNIVTQVERVPSATLCVLDRMSNYAAELHRVFEVDHTRGGGGPVTTTVHIFGVNACEFRVSLVF
jgi:hypothetical protein